jgi:hypothetical protein
MFSSVVYIKKNYYVFKAKHCHEYKLVSADTLIL